MSGASAMHGGTHPMGTTYSTRNYSQHPVYVFIFVVTVDLQWPRWSSLGIPYWYLHTGAMAPSIGVSAHTTATTALDT